MNTLVQIWNQYTKQSQLTLEGNWQKQNHYNQCQSRTKSTILHWRQQEHTAVCKIDWQENLTKIWQGWKKIDYHIQHEILSLHMKNWMIRNPIYLECGHLEQKCITCIKKEGRNLTIWIVRGNLWPLRVPTKLLMLLIVRWDRNAQLHILHTTKCTQLHQGCKHAMSILTKWAMAST